MIKHIFYLGDKHSRWALKVVIHQSHDSYKFVIYDPDEPWYIGTNYLTAKTANLIESLIVNICNNTFLETLSDFQQELSKSFLYPLFYERQQISPQLTDGVIILAES